MLKTAIADIAPQQPRRRKITEKRRAQNREAQRLFRQRQRKRIFENASQPPREAYLNSQTQARVPIEQGQPDPQLPAIVDLAPEPCFAGISDTPNDGPCEEHSYRGLAGLIRLANPLNRAEDIDEMASRIYNIDYIANKTRGKARNLVNLQLLLNDTPGESISPDPVMEIMGAPEGLNSLLLDGVTQEASLPGANQDQSNPLDVPLTTGYKPAFDSPVPIRGEACDVTDRNVEPQELQSTP
ncbi:hypothetical protein DRE_01202 [Drechslerella stenobrocha 248]|uniref:BZIP domain-containing protein n=1 Tax=Drechslerella stenobrocha 248 TaxID=1043628 RepID=W7HK48_9PEZI|nr:hypothetical protein DRE_01202 [Drechslerella stenobrocha 248]